MNYIRRINNVVYIDDIEVNKSINFVLNELAKDNFREIESIRKIIKNKTGIKKNIPLYINEEILLIPIKESNNDITYLNIINVDFLICKEYSAVICFRNDKQMELNISKYVFNKIIERKNKVLDLI